MWARWLTAAPRRRSRRRGCYPDESLQRLCSVLGVATGAADSSRMPNLGQQDVSFKTPTGHGRSLRFQVVDVERPLISVSHLSKTGHKVEFEGSQGFIIHKQSGKRIRLQRMGGV